jgi:hypothetical protein
VNSIAMEKELDDEDRFARLGLIVALSSALLIAIGVCFFYFWYASYRPNDYTDVYSRLGLDPQPVAVEQSSSIKPRLSQLKREPCFKDAVAELSAGLSEDGYPREAANSLIGFVKRCPGSDFLLANAYGPLMQIGDLRGAFRWPRSSVSCQFAISILAR